MSKYIDVDKCEEYFYEHMDDKDMEIALIAINDMPAADVQEVRHGRWVDLKCDQCGQVDMSKPNYCPNCGSRMDLEGEEE